MPETSFLLLLLPPPCPATAEALQGPSVPPAAGPGPLRCRPHECHVPAKQGDGSILCETVTLRSVLTWEESLPLFLRQRTNHTDKKF